MIDSSLAGTSLPNLHPALVHFPIACLPLALAFDLMGILWPKQRWSAPAATLLYCFAAISGWISLWSGKRAANGLTDVAAAVQPLIGKHSDWAHYAAYGLTALAVIRVLLHLNTRLTDHRGARAAVVVLGLGLMGVVGITADLGGGLVYEHGLAVKKTADVELTPTLQAVVDPAPSSPAVDRWLQAEDGSWVWRPLSRDRDALGSVLVPTSTAEEQTVRWVEGSGPAGLSLEVDGTATLLLPGSFGDVQVEARLELQDFSGSFGLVHHFQPGSYGSFLLSSEGDAQLADTREGATKTLDQKTVAVSTTPFTVSVSAAGKHLKGLLDGKTITHGHIAPGPNGACGLHLDGEGQLKILDIRVIPLGGH